ncbi:hypothetical protein [Pseudomonas citronellolis]|uniref:hypothetical protein n=1 Tax=Pseudomonas citronellolis TaxID=53408 RepID=UPI0008530E31|nr:hypothetical protein [Pseudomonas humi]
MAAFLEADCPKCGTPYLSITACSAAHDQSLIDLVVSCDDCGHILNAFISLSEMTEVTVPSEELSHG